MVNPQHQIVECIHTDTNTYKRTHTNIRSLGINQANQDMHGLTTFCNIKNHILKSSDQILSTNTHTHTHAYTYVYVQMYKHTKIHINLIDRQKMIQHARHNIIAVAPLKQIQLTFMHAYTIINASMIRSSPSR